MDLLRNEGDLLFKEYVDALSPSDIKVLRTLAKDPTARPNKVASEEFMDARTVAGSLIRLQKKGIVRKEGRANYRFTDSLFAEWLKVSDLESGHRLYL